MCGVKALRVWGPAEGARTVRGGGEVWGRAGGISTAAGPTAPFPWRPLSLTVGDVGPLRLKAGGCGGGPWLPLDSLVLR